jgi:hypothetical protein
LVVRNAAWIGVRGSGPVGVGVGVVVVVGVAVVASSWMVWCSKMWRGVMV